MTNMQNPETGRERFFVSPRLITILILLTCLGALAPAARGASKVWSGNGANNNWNTGANWGGSAPNAGDDLIFPAGALKLVNTNNFSAGTVFSSITFTGTDYAIWGNGLTLTSVNGVRAQNTVFTNTVNVAIQLNTALNFDSTAAGGTLIVAGNIALNGFNLTNNATGTIRLSGAISGTGNVVKNGTGKLSLEGGGSNSYIGTTYANAGTTDLNKVITAIPGDLVVGNGVAAATVRTIIFQDITDAATVTVNKGSTYDLNGLNEAIGGLTLNAGSVTTGVGTLTLLGNLTSLAASTTASISGNLSLGGATRTFAVASGDPSPDLLISATIVDGGGSAGIIKTGQGYMTLSASNAFTGSITADGRLTLQHALALGASGSAANGTVINAGAVLALSGLTITNETLMLNSSGMVSASGTVVWEGRLY